MSPEFCAPAARPRAAGRRHAAEPRKPATRFPGAVVGALFGLVRSGLRRLGEGRRRARLQAALVGLDERLLRDIGVSRTEAQHLGLGLSRNELAA